MGIQERERLSAEAEQMEALFFGGRYAELEVRALALIEWQPNLGFAWSVLGAALQHQGKDALFAVRKAAQLLPEDATAHFSLGDALHAHGDYQGAADSYQRALELNADIAEIHNNLGNTQRKLNDFGAALASYLRALQLNPNFAEGFFNLGSTLKDMGRYEEAESNLNRAIQLKSDFYAAHVELGSTLNELGRTGDAEVQYRKAIRIAPQMTEAHGNLGVTLRDMGRLHEAETSYRTALKIEPNIAGVQNNLGSLLSDLGRFDEAERCFRRAIQIDPAFAQAYSNLLFHLSHGETISAQALHLEHLGFASTFEAPYKPLWQRHDNLRDLNRCLRVGIVSADLRDHPIAFYIEPILAQLGNRQNLSLYAFHNQAREDAVSLRLKAHFSHWRAIAGLSDEAVARLIREDQIDVLIDLSGHSASNRLLTFARKPAPVQLSWMGYGGTTGLSAMDYYLADSFLLPTGLLDHQFSEKLVQLPAAAPFLPYADAPPVGVLPASKNHFLTFGSFNLARKLSPAVIATWSQILRGLPTSRMLIGGMNSPDEIDKMSESFLREGIPRNRLTFFLKCPMPDYLQLHNQVDILLDTFPYPGATTSCHAMWMGVPTITMAGETAVSRVGVALARHAGLDGFVATSRSDFVDKALYWSSHVSELAAIRSELRAKFAQSAVGRPQLIADSVEQALRTMWQRWCAGLPPESFEVNSV